MKKLLLAVAALGLGACASVPTAPSVMVLPGGGKSFEAFRDDDGVCRDWAGHQMGVDPAHQAHRDIATGAVVGSAVGAAAGALIGVASGAAGPGAAIGAGTGLLLGTASGASVGGNEWGSLQSRYDTAYMQCMYAKGNQIPMAQGSLPAAASDHPPRPRHRVPRPPPGPPPPPPPDLG